MKRWRQLILAALLTGPVAVTAQPTQLYIDKTNGQVFATPGPNRVRIDNQNGADEEPERHKSGLTQESNFLKGYGFTDTPGQSAHRPRDPHKEKLTIYGRIQFRDAMGSANTAYSNGHKDFNANDFAFRRLRLGAIYQGSDWWGAVINMRLENQINSTQLTTSKQTVTIPNGSGGTQTISYLTSAKLHENRGGIQEAVGWFKIPFASSKITFGHINLPFNRQYIGSSQNLIGLERSMGTIALPQFDDGVMLSINPLSEIFGKKWDKYWEVFGFIGDGRGAAGDYGTGRKQSLTYTWHGKTTLALTPTYIWRMVFNPLGGLVNQVGKEVGWQEGEEIFQNSTKWSIGMSGWMTQNFNTTNSSSLQALAYWMPKNAQSVYILNPQLNNVDYGNSQFGNVFYNPLTQGLVGNTASGTLVQNTSTSPGLPKMGLNVHTYDTTFFSHGFYANGAITYFNGPAAPKNTMSYYAQFGYIIPILKKYYIMPVIMFDHLQGDFNRDGRMTAADQIMTTWYGLDIFLDKHLAKIQIFYANFQSHLGTNPVTGGPKALDSQMFIIQGQISFQSGTVTREQHYEAPENIYRAN